ncbi:MAG: glycosyltransferase [Sphingobacteriales bacterium]|nr:MAG: glycosyltransferase [Sphingobacteriales bacterium]
MQQASIALVTFGDGLLSCEHNFAEQWQLSNNVHQCIDELKRILNSTQCEWLLFWDAQSKLPPEDLFYRLTNSPIDVWHAGIKMGMAGLPKTIDYINPTWMYNKDAAADVEHSSFRLSMRASLIRVEALRLCIEYVEEYSSVDAMGVAFGYAMFKSGCIMRYHPELIAQQKDPIRFTKKDEWIFARQFLTPKWHAWLLYSKGFLSNIKTYLSTASIGYRSLKPRVHRSDVAIQDVQYKSISVLAPTLKRYPYLVNELKQLSVQTILSHEVLITDQTEEAERELLPLADYPQLNIQYFPQQEKGQCLAWNKLLSEATGEYVLFLGDDADHITPHFLEKLLGTAQRMNADMVASNVIEIGTPDQPINPYYLISSTFPITLIKKEILNKTGYMDMFFNRNIRADQDLSMRCHLQGTLMIFDPSATIHHHRASVGGLRVHKARAVTNFMAKNSISKFVVPTSSELYLAKKYFNEQQFRNFVRIKYVNQLLVNGSVFRKMLKLIVFGFKYPAISKLYNRNLHAAEEAFTQLMKTNPDVRRYEGIAGN